jgi:hypothetical protein
MRADAHWLALLVLGLPRHVLFCWLVLGWPVGRALRWQLAQHAMMGRWAWREARR